jgi:hypothetical protein
MSPAQAPHPRPIGQSSDSPRPPSLTKGDQFALGGPSTLPDPATHAYRKDLADLKLAGHVVASHYAEATPRHLNADTTLRVAPAADAPALAELAKGDSFELLDDTSGWAWGYGGGERLVGYVESAALER